LSLPNIGVVWKTVCKALGLQVTVQTNAQMQAPPKPANLWNLLNDCGGHAYSIKGLYIEGSASAEHFGIE